MALPFVAMLAPVLGTLVDRLIPDKAEAARTKAQLEADLLKTANEVNLAQIEVNKTEAQHASVFVSGWRPAIGWTCACALAYYYVGYDWLTFLLALSGSPAQLPRPEPGMLMELVMAMLGFGGLRTFEKLRGVNSK